MRVMKLDKKDVGMNHAVGGILQLKWSLALEATVRAAKMNLRSLETHYISKLITY